MTDQTISPLRRRMTEDMNDSEVRAEDPTCGPGFGREPNRSAC
jgi:hypothetical protein